MYKRKDFPSRNLFEIIASCTFLYFYYYYLYYVCGNYYDNVIFYVGLYLLMF